MKKILLAVAVLIAPFLDCNLTEAKRGPAPEVESVIYKGIKFIASNTPQRMGYVEAWDIETKRKAWEQKVYTVVFDRLLEQDVQWVFISSLNIEDKKLVVTDERGKEYRVDIPKNILKEQVQPLQLTIKSDKQVYEVGEEIIISGYIENTSKQDTYIYPLEQTLTVTYDIIGPQGNKIDVPLPIIDLWTPKKDDFVLIKAGGSLPKTFKLYLTREVFPALSGIYTISVKYDVWDKGYYENGKFMDLNAWTGMLTSNTIIIEVVEKK